MPRSRTASAVLTYALGLSLAACSGDSQSGGTDGPSAEQPTSQSASSGEPQEDDVRIKITVEGETFAATLRDSAASRDLVAQLPVTVEMRDHGSVEKTGPLPTPLSLDGQPDGADPDVGDVGYYAPGNDFVLYYGDQSYFSGIVILGSMDAGGAERLGRLDGSITATVELLAG